MFRTLLSLLTLPTLLACVLGACSGSDDDDGPDAAADAASPRDASTFRPDGG